MDNFKQDFQETVQTPDSNMLRSFGINGSTLVAVVRGDTFSKTHADVRYEYEAEQFATALFADWKGSKSAGSFYNKFIVPRGMKFKRTDLPK